MHGKYIPTHASNRQKHPNVTNSLRIPVVSTRLKPLAAMTVCKSLCLDDQHLWSLFMTQLNSIEPSIIEPMKLAKMMPKGRMLRRPDSLCDAFKAGVQKKTKRYMEPSKQQATRPKVRVCLSTFNGVSTISASQGFGTCLHVSFQNSFRPSRVFGYQCDSLSETRSSTMS